MEENDSESEIFAGLTLPRLLNRSPSDQIEFLEEIPSEPIKLAITAAALGNHRGGVIILGADRKGNVVGTNDPNDLVPKIDNIYSNFIQPRLDYNPKPVEYGNHHVLAIVVKNKSTLYSVSWEGEICEDQTEEHHLYYIRAGSSQRPMSPIGVWQFMQPSVRNEGRVKKDQGNRGGYRV